MKPTLLVGDFLVVSKPTYGYSRASLVYPMTRLPLDGRIFAGAPKRGDILVFKTARTATRTTSNASSVCQAMKFEWLAGASTSMARQ